MQTEGSGRRGFGHKKTKTQKQSARAQEGAYLGFLQHNDSLSSQQAAAIVEEFVGHWLRKRWPVAGDPFNDERGVRACEAGAGARRVCMCCLRCTVWQYTVSWLKFCDLPYPRHLEHVWRA